MFTALYRDPDADEDEEGIWKNWHATGVCSTADQAAVLNAKDKADGLEAMTLSTHEVDGLDYFFALDSAIGAMNYAVIPEDPDDEPCGLPSTLTVDLDDLQGVAKMLEDEGYEVIVAEIG